MTSLQLNLTLQSYFDSTTLSDILVKFGTHEVRGHKIILASGSGFFKTCFEGQYKEASAAGIRLHDDDPDALRAVIAHMYGIRSDGFTYFTTNVYSDSKYPPAKTINRGLLPEGSTEPEEVSSDIETAHLEYLVNLYVTAAKYLVGDLAERVRLHFQSMHPSMFCNFGVGLDKIVTSVYITHGVAAKGLRSALVALCSHPSVRLEKTTLTNVPDFAAELAVKLKEISSDRDGADLRKRVREPAVQQGVYAKRRLGGLERT